MNNNIENNAAPQKNAKLPIISLILGIVGFFFNPLWIVSGVSIGLAIASLAKKLGNKGLAIGGLCAGAASLISQVFADTLITVLSMGLGFFVFFI